MLQRKVEAAARAASGTQSIRVFVKGVRPDGEVTTVGPIAVAAEDTIAVIEGRIHVRARAHAACRSARARQRWRRVGLLRVASRSRGLRST